MKTEKVIYNFWDGEEQYMRVDKLGRRMYDVSEDIKVTFYHEYPGLAPDIDIFDDEPYTRFSCALDECGGDVEEAISMAFGSDSAKNAIAFEVYNTYDEYLRTDYHAIDWVLATELDHDKAIKLAQSRDEHPERGEIKWDPRSRWLYRGDAQNGFRERWFANGQIYDRANLKNGLYDGIYERWNLSGSRDFIEEYSKGESVAQYFWENSKNSWGDLRAIADYVLANDGIDLLNDEAILKYDEKGCLKQEEPKAKKKGLKI